MKAKVPKFTAAACPKCGKITAFVPKTEKMDEGIEHSFFECSGCGHRATICYTDQAIREALEKKQALNKAGDGAGMQKMAEELELMMDVLMLKMEGTQPTQGG